MTRVDPNAGTPAPDRVAEPSSRAMRETGAPIRASMSGTRSGAGSRGAGHPPQDASILAPMSATRSPALATAH